jgi:TRAP-type C4-dicarboxylate transport system permease small subunit
MSLIAFFRKWVERVNRVIGAIGAGILVILMLVTGIDVIGRYLLRRPLTGAYELTELALAAIVLLGWGYTQLVKSHVDIDLLYNRLPRSVQKILDIFAPLLGLVLFIFVSWQAINFTRVSIGWHEITDMIHLPVWIFKSMIFIGSVSISLQFLVDIITACQRAKEKI